MIETRTIVVVIKMVWNLNVIKIDICWFIKRRICEIKKNQEYVQDIQDLNNYKNELVIYWEKKIRV